MGSGCRPVQPQAARLGNLTPYNPASMEADRINLIEANLQDLAARAQELRRYL